MRHTTVLYAPVPHIWLQTSNDKMLWETFLSLPLFVSIATARLTFHFKIAAKTGTTHFRWGTHKSVCTFFRQHAASTEWCVGCRRRAQSRQKHHFNGRTNVTENRLQKNFNIITVTWLSASSQPAQHARFTHAPTILVLERQQQSWREKAREEERIKKNYIKSIGIHFIIYPLIYLSLGVSLS